MQSDLICSADLPGVSTQTYSNKMLNDSAYSSLCYFLNGAKECIFQFYSSDWHLIHVYYY